MTTTYTTDEIFALAVSYCTAAYPGKSVKPRSFLWNQAYSFAQLVGSIQAAIRDADRDSVPATEAIAGVLRSRCSAAALDRWCHTFGLPSNRGAGLYGRNGAQAAVNGVGAVTGAATTIVPTGALLVDESGTQQVELVAGVTIPAGGSINGTFQAVEPGAGGNLPVGARLRWVSPVAGSAAYVTLSTALSGGYDVEDDLSLVLRLLRRLQSPPKGGTAADIREWAEQATDATGRSLGISRAYVFRHRNGIGSSDVCITQAGSGSGRDPGSTKAAQVQSTIDALKIATDTIRVVRPYFDPAAKLKITLKVVPTPRHSFDWSDGAVGVTTVSSTTTTTTIATASVPASLASAVASGAKPRIQFSLPGSSPLPYQRRAVSSTPSGFNTVFTLDAALPTAPGAGAIVYAGGGAVEPAALAALAEVDSVGPSKQSGTADTVTDSWVAVVGVGAIGCAVLDAVDSGGDRVAEQVPGVGTGNGVLIAVGAGPNQSADVQLYDNSPSQGPQLPEVYSIIVLQG